MSTKKHRYIEGTPVKICNAGQIYNGYKRKYEELGMNGGYYHIHKDYMYHIYKVKKCTFHENGVALYHIVSNKGCNILIGEEGVILTIERYD